MVAAVEVIIDDGTHDCDAKNMLRWQGVGAKLTGRGRPTPLGIRHMSKKEKTDDATTPAVWGH